MRRMCYIFWHTSSLEYFYVQEGDIESLKMKEGIEVLQNIPLHWGHLNH